ncbi:MAG: hypothetical protein HY209_00330 [Candidatus Omnitrophica bacterium]|nr:hypothetical protein [Candidatus Omnitrophota bacterium]
MKILVIHATAGAGHKKAAEAIYNGLLRHTTHIVRLVDSLDYTNPFFKAAYPKTYVFLVTKLPMLWGFFFWLSDLALLQPLIRWIRRCYNASNTKALEKFLKDEDFDAIIVTHFMSAEVGAYLKRTRQIRAKVICVVTDFNVHRIWINQGTDLYTAACDDTKEKIISLGISPDQVFVTGIPTDEKFTVMTDRRQIREALKIDPQLFTVLLATGSFGVGPMEELVDLLKGYQLLIVCGHNRLLYERLKSRINSKVHVFGLVNNMHELMSAADVMVTKPGGLSIAEALVKRLPIIFFSAIPGQETGNIKVLQKYQAASPQGSLMDIVDKIDDLSSSLQVYEAMQKKLEALAKPDAVRDIISLI